MMYDFFVDLFGNTVIAGIASGILMSLLPLFLFILPYALFAVLAERKVSAHMQDRLGPMRIGWHGWNQTIADIIKLIQKEDIVASDTDKPLFNFAPVLVFAGSYAAFAAIPFSSYYIGSEVDLGIFYIIAVTGLVVAGILMAGWASNNKYSLLGAMRSAAQIISYEIPTLLIILTIVIISGTLSFYDLSEMQTAYFWNWYIFGGPEFGIQKIQVEIASESGRLRDAVVDCRKQLVVARVSTGLCQCPLHEPALVKPSGNLAAEPTFNVLKPFRLVTKHHLNATACVARLSDRRSQIFEVGVLPRRGGRGDAPLQPRQSCREFRHLIGEENVQFGKHGPYSSQK